MICTSCNGYVTTLLGAGEYPNPTYKCPKCHDDDTGKMLGLACKIAMAGTLAAMYTGLLAVIWYFAGRA